MNGMKQTCLVLSASTYKITDDKGEITNTGMTVFYLPTDNLNPIEDAQAAEQGRMVKGLQPAKVNLPTTLAAKIIAAPAMYNLTLQMTVSQLKTQIKPVDIEYLGAVQMHVEQPKK